MRSGGVPPLTDEDCERAVEALRQAGGNTAEAGRILGLPRNTFNHRLSKAAARGFMGTKPVLPGYEIKSTSTQLGPDGEVQREWVRQGKAPGEEFAPPEGHAIKGVSALVGPDGRVLQQWIKTREDTTADFLAAVKAALEGCEGRAVLAPSPEHVDDELLSVYPIVDAHHGLMSWRPETGENYDLAISAERLSSCMRRLVSQSPPSKNALILNLGDYFHSNDRTNATPASKNGLDVDGRWQKVVTTGVDLFRQTIDMALERHETVTIRCLPGNHDPDASIILTIALGYFYRNEPRVIVDQDPSEFFFRLFGNTLIGACHGHKMKPDRMAMTMATVRPEEWGKAKYRWFVFGHIHHETVKEVGDVRCESFQTVAARDAYTAGAGYTAGQSMSSITLHCERGEIGRHRVNIPPSRAS